MDTSRIYKQELVKPDGRALTLYARAPLQGPFTPTNPQGAAPPAVPPHLRWHPLREEWVAFAGHRQNRTFLPPKEYNPLAPTLNPEFPTELPAGDYDIAVFDNLFSALVLSANAAPDNVNVATRAANGHCEVVVFTQDPETALGRLPLDRIELLLRVWADRYRIVGGREQIAYVLPFENRGVEVGVTLHHPHGQIYAYPELPPLEAQMLRAQEQHFIRTGEAMLPAMVARERESQTRVVVEGEFSTAFIPPCARYPYETWIVPHRQVARLENMTDAELGDLARVLKTVLLKFDGLWDRPFPYLMALYAAPADGAVHPEWQFHIEFYPPYRSRDRLKFLAGTELAAGLFINDSLPEEKAAELRAVKVDV